MGLRIQDLGPSAQRQVLQKLNQLEREKKARAGQQIRKEDQGSQLEQEYYAAYIWPKELAGLI